MSETGSSDRTLCGELSAMTIDSRQCWMLMDELKWQQQQQLL